MERKTDKRYDEYKTQYTKSKYYKIGLYVDIKEKDKIKTAAAKAGLSLNMYINKAIQEKMIRDDLKTDNDEQ